MGWIKEPGRRVPVIEEVDVLVVGGGTAGLPAAVAATRLGARVALVEKWGYAGGEAVGGLVLTIPLKSGVWGIEQEFNDELQQMGGLALVNKGPKLGEWAILSAPLAKCLADLWLQRAGVTVLYHTLAVDVAMKGDRIGAVIVESKSGRQALRAHMVVDATGDADIARRAGAPCRLGHGNGEMEPVTLMYNVANVDVARYKAEHRESKPSPGRVSAFEPTVINEGEANCWGGSLTGHGADNRGLTRLEMDLRAAALEEWRNMRQHLPGFERSYISCLAEQLGVRETYLLDAEYVLTQADREARRQFEDSIGRCWDCTAPYRSLIPRGVTNLLVAGRCIGAEHARLIRIAPNCFTTGQAAGTAAAMAVASCGPRATARGVDVGKLQESLRKQGVCLTAASARE
jgi:hypothetical protein